MHCEAKCTFSLHEENQVTQNLSTLVHVCNQNLELKISLEVAFFFGATAFKSICRKVGASSKLHPPPPVLTMASFVKSYITARSYIDCLCGGGGGKKEALLFQENKTNDPLGSYICSSTIGSSSSIMKPPASIWWSRHGSSLFMSNSVDVRRSDDAPLLLRVIAQFSVAPVRYIYIIHGPQNSLCQKNQTTKKGKFYFKNQWNLSIFKLFLRCYFPTLKSKNILHPRKKQKTLSMRER